MYRRADQGGKHPDARQIRRRRAYRLILGKKDRHIDEHRRQDIGAQAEYAKHRSVHFQPYALALYQHDAGKEDRRRHEDYRRLLAADGG